MSDLIDDDLLREFFSEAYDQVGTIEDNILKIEKSADDMDAVNEIFRAAHTLKGSSATVHMLELSEFTHIVEDVFDDIRNNKLKIDNNIVDILLESLDIIKNMVSSRDNGEVYSEDISDLKNRLHALIVKDNKKSTATPQKPKETPAKKEDSPKTNNDNSDDISKILSLNEIRDLQDKSEEAHLFRVSILFNSEDPMKEVFGIQVYAMLKDRGELLKSIPSYDVLFSDEFNEKVEYFLSTDRSDEDIQIAVFSIPDAIKSIKITDFKNFLSDNENTTKQEEIKKESSDDTSKNSEAKKSQQAPTEPSASNKKQSTLLKVESSRIDDLLNLVSEIVINKATFSQITAEFNSSILFLQDLQREASYLGSSINDSIDSYSINSLNKNIELKRDLDTKIIPVSTGVKNFQGSFKSTLVKFRNSLQNMNRIISELQEGVMKIRMVPIGQIFHPFQRTVRDLCKKLSKDVNLVVIGEDVELDKSVAEDLKNPLMHCVRNSMDHGIEIPESRIQKGKTPDGTLILKAANEGNTILIEISDDGAGINSEVIRNKALEKGLIKEGDELSENEVHNLLFHAGFSTAKEITDISGRGVGLDVVKSNIEKLNGTILISSEFGIGTTFTIRIPLTLAIIQGLLIKVYKETYVIPIASIVDSHRVKAEDVKYVDNYEVINIRGEYISVLRLQKLFNIFAVESEYCYIVVVTDGIRKVGILVDRLIGEEDVVIKPLKDSYSNVPGIAGANITGNGRVSLIIDVIQLIDLGIKKEMIYKERREVKVNISG